MNVWDWVILSVIAAAVLAGVRRGRKNGASCHGAGCSDCTCSTGCTGCNGCSRKDTQP